MFGQLDTEIKEYLKGAGYIRSIYQGINSLLYIFGTRSGTSYFSYFPIAHVCEVDCNLNKS